MNAILSDFERNAEGRAKHRALIMQLLVQHPGGLTSQQLLEREREVYGYTFLSDNRCRELRSMGWVVSEKGSDGLIRWKVKKNE